ncbi:protein FosB [Podarcis raffonei]|uniref:FosB proto-onco, AP-1 transcription factor subunit n=1 Tax=Podarcis muralis TaxID=64176 RepID=A0A670JF26_PODMU|nr:protein fosB [Podarcis muralis]XP_053253669.1 protein FosB [Podarcis raffonei]
MYQGFPGDYDSTSRCSSSPSAESQYLSSVDSFGSPTAAAAASSQECSGLGEMPGSFVPTVTAISTSQDLQWLVQPTLISSMAQSQQPPGQQMPQQQQQQQQPPTVDPYDLPGTSYSTPGLSAAYGAGPSGLPAAQPRSTRARPRRTREETLTPEEEEKRRVRRERNKLAAAKCRNRRRELTDRLQAETDQLEEEKAELESEIAELQKERERLEFVLVAHKPSCKIPYEDVPELIGQPGTSGEVSALALAVKEDPFGPTAYSSLPLHYQQTLGGVQALSPAEVAFSSSYFSHGEQLTDPYPANPSYTSSFVFTYPEGASCGATHQRNSSSDQSSDSLNSPSLLAL